MAEEFAEGMASMVTDEKEFLKFMEGCRVVEEAAGRVGDNLSPAIPSALAHSPLPGQNKLSEGKRKKQSPLNRWVKARALLPLSIALN